MGLEFCRKDFRRKNKFPKI